MRRFLVNFNIWLFFPFSITTEGNVEEFKAGSSLPIVYNLTTAGVHAYAVGEGLLLAHNASGDPFAALREVLLNHEILTMIPMEAAEAAASLIRESTPVPISMDQREALRHMLRGWTTQLATVPRSDSQGALLIQGQIAQVLSGYGLEELYSDRLERLRDLAGRASESTSGARRELLEEMITIVRSMNDTLAIPASRRTMDETLEAIWNLEFSHSVFLSFYDPLIEITELRSLLALDPHQPAYVPNPTLIQEINRRIDALEPNVDAHLTIYRGTRVRNELQEATEAYVRTTSTETLGPLLEAYRELMRVMDDRASAERYRSAQTRLGRQLAHAFLIDPNAARDIFARRERPPGPEEVTTAFWEDLRAELRSSSTTERQREASEQYLLAAGEKVRYAALLDALTSISLSLRDASGRLLSPAVVALHRLRIDLRRFGAMADFADSLARAEEIVAEASTHQDGIPAAVQHVRAMVAEIERQIMARHAQARRRREGYEQALSELRELPISGDDPVSLAKREAELNSRASHSLRVYLRPFESGRLRERIPTRSEASTMLAGIRSKLMELTLAHRDEIAADLEAALQALSTRYDRWGTSWPQRVRDAQTLSTVLHRLHFRVHSSWLEANERIRRLEGRSSSRPP